MAPSTEIGQTDLRAEVVDKVIKGFATASYKFKQAVSVVSTGAWQNTYYREASGALTGSGNNAVKGIPRGANFPQAVVEWEKLTSWVEKYGLEDNIMWEDILSDNVDVKSRTLYRIAEGVASAVDAEIWSVLSEDRAGSATTATVDIQEVALEVASEKGKYWDVASAAIIDDIMNAKQRIGQFNYPTSNLMMFISERDHRSIVKYLADSGAQFPSIGEEMARNGRVGKIAGVNLVVSNNVTASYALVVVPKICGTWKASVPLKTEVTVDPFKSVRVRAVEMGVLQLTDPKAVCVISGTQSRFA